MFAFADFRLDVATRQLRDGPDPVHLSPKAFQLLLCLVEDAPRALSKSELLDRVWPATFVSEATLTSVVAEVRDALKDDARSPRFVRTVHRFGYAFCAVVSRSDDPLPTVRTSAWSLHGPSGDFALLEGENVVGRESGLAVRIDSATVSRRHARIVVTGLDVAVEDLRSKNGTFVEGERVVTLAVMRDGDRLTIGTVPLVVRVQSEAGSTLTAAAVLS